MDFKLIISTFFVIFLAELGDKTQFAAMAASAGSSKPVSILIGSVLALTISSVIAVAAGAVIGNLVPVRYIKIAAGVLFLVFGSLYIKESFSTEEVHENPAQSSNILSYSIIKAAKTFEEEELKMFVAARASISESGCREVFDGLIKQEEGHLNILHNMKSEETSIFKDDLKAHQVLTDTFACSDDDDKTLREIYIREEAMADFYLIMSEKSRITSVRAALQELYHEEKGHAERIKLLLKQT